MIPVVRDLLSRLLKTLSSCPQPSQLYTLFLSFMLSNGSHNEWLLVLAQDLQCHRSGPWLCFHLFTANSELNSSSGGILLRQSSDTTSSLKPSWLPFLAEFTLLCSLKTSHTTNITSWGLYHSCVVSLQGVQSVSGQHMFFLVALHTSLLPSYQTGLSCMCLHLLILLGIYPSATINEAGADPVGHYIIPTWFGRY